VAQQQPSGRRIWPVVVVAALIVVVAFGATRLGHRGTGPNFVQGGRIQGKPLHVASVIDFDPLGDKSEGHSTVTKIDDGQATTFWETEMYKSSATFNGLKQGVGVIFDMGKSVAVGKAQVLFVGAPCSFELRFSDDRNAPVGEWPT